MRWSTAVGPLAGALALLGALGAPPSAGQPAANAVRVHSLSPGDTVYVLLDGGGHSLAVVDEENGGVVLVDTKAAGWGQTIADAVSLVTELPVTTIINTHAHADHAGSNGEFPAAPHIFAHENAGAGRSVTTFRDTLSLFDGANRIELYHFGPAHTDGDTVVVFPEKGVAHVGDLINGKAAPVIDADNGGSGVAYPETLAKLVAGIDGVDSVITGHGPLPPVPGVHGMLQTLTWEDVAEYAAFNRDFLAAVREAFDAGTDAAEAAATLRLPERYADYGMEQAAANVRSIYDELAGRGDEQ
ncbi:MAG: MBL fold metallo-hydrolase [Acidobacteria bacterium]|nr:MBL fold metallo-hydrolase [Acidobacteriota bacterium]